jgi:hypothetical protein
MPREFFDPTPEEQNVVLVDAATLRKAEKMIESCEQCNREGAEIPFDNILDRVTGSDPNLTDYILKEPAKCPRRFRQVTEKTLVELE